MTERLWPAETVFLATVHEDIVILDLEADHYVGLLDANAWIDLQPDGSALVRDRAVVRELLETGFLRALPPARARKFPKPVRGELTAAPGCGLASTAMAIPEIIEASLAFQRLSLSALIGAVNSWPPDGKPTDDERLSRSVGAYLSALPFVPFEGECLQRAFQLKRILDRRALHTDWVFGVRTWPFGAHCWIQRDHQVVGDSLERVRLYTPIMVV